MMSFVSWASYWNVLFLFLVPIGGGIPAGVVVGDHNGLHWTSLCGLYLISDLVLAFFFEPLMLWFIRASEKSAKLTHVKNELTRSTSMMLKHLYGPATTLVAEGKDTTLMTEPSEAAPVKFHLSPLSLILLTFGTDPMTGRSIAKIVGHGAITGWSLVFIGDMMFFIVVMVSTLSLNSYLGDGTWTAVIITVAIFGVPALIRYLRAKWRGETTA